MAAYAVLSTGGTPGGEAAHLGGGIPGFVLIKNQHLLNLFAPSARPAVGVRRRTRGNQKDSSKDPNR